MRFTIPRAAVLVLGTIAPTAIARAQSTPASVGERVRIETAAQHGRFRYVGRVVAVNGDTLQVQSAGLDGPRSVAISDIRSLEVSAGTTTNGRKGMVYGTLGGAIVGAALGAATWSKPECDNEIFCPVPDVTRGADALAGGILGGVVGLAIGGFWGKSHLSERWITRPLGSTRSLSVVPSGGGGATLRLSIAFQGALPR